MKMSNAKLEVEVYFEDGLRARIAHLRTFDNVMASLWVPLRHWIRASAEAGPMYDLWCLGALLE